MENKDVVMKRMETVLEMVQSIYELIRDDKISYKAKRPLIVDKTKTLKEHLKSEKRRLEKLENRDQLSRYESAFYLPAVSGAHANFLAPYNTTDMDKLTSSLYDVKYEFRYFYSQLNDIE